MSASRNFEWLKDRASPISALSSFRNREICNKPRELSPRLQVILCRQNSLSTTWTSVNQTIWAQYTYLRLGRGKEREEGDSGREKLKNATFRMTTKQRYQAIRHVLTYYDRLISWSWSRDQDVASDSKLSLTWTPNWPNFPAKSFRT